MILEPKCIVVLSFGSAINKISVSIIGSKKFVGIGKSKQQAEQDGATKLLKNKNIY